MADDITFRWTGIPEFNAALDDLVARVDAASAAGIVKVAHLIEAQAKANASGRPGPNVITGTLRRSIVLDPESPVRSGDGWTISVGPSVLYGRRVELGFRGTDSIGRTFTGAGKYPYFTPAVESIIPRIADVMRDAWATAVEES